MTIKFLPITPVAIILALIVALIYQVNTHSSAATRCEAAGGVPVKPATSSGSSIICIDKTAVKDLK